MSNFDNYPNYRTPEQRALDAQFPERGGCLTIWLIAAILLNVGYGGITYLQILELYSDPRVQAVISPFYVIALGVLLLMVSVGLFAIWNWKRWGVYLVVVAIIFSIFVQVGPVNPVRSYLAPIVQLAILYFLISPRWHIFK